MIADTLFYFVGLYMFFYLITQDIMTSSLLAISVIIAALLIITLLVGSTKWVLDHTLMNYTDSTIVKFIYNNIILVNAIYSIAFIATLILTKRA
jgi:hypothetical protein